MPDIYAVWESHGWIAPKVLEEYSPDRTILQLCFIENKGDESAIKIGDKSAIKIGDKKSATTEERLLQIMGCMETGTEYRAEEISSWVGLKDSRVRELLKMLVERDIIEISGKNKSRRYRKR